MYIFFIFIGLVCLLTISAVCYLISFFNNEAEEPTDIILEKEDETNG
mgnify:CR=1 FL=1